MCLSPQSTLFLSVCIDIRTTCSFDKRIFTRSSGNTHAQPFGNYLLHSPHRFLRVNLSLSHPLNIHRGTRAGKKGSPGMATVSVWINSPSHLSFMHPVLHMFEDQDLLRLTSRSDRHHLYNDKKFQNQLLHPVQITFNNMSMSTDE